MPEPKKCFVCGIEISGRQHRYCANCWSKISRKHSSLRLQYAKELRAQLLTAQQSPSLSVVLPEDKSRSVTSVIANKPVRGDEWIREVMQ